MDQPTPRRAWAFGTDVDPSAPPPHEHVVRFYDDESALVQGIAAYLADGLLAAAPGFVISPESRSLAIRDALGSMGVDVERALALGQIEFLDAGTALSRFMVDGLPDRALFDLHIGEPLARLARAWQPRRLRAYGDMVDRLWANGNAPGALALENLWNDLIERVGFALHCAYDQGHFHRDAHRAGFDAVCRAHGRILPLEEATPPA